MSGPADRPTLLHGCARAATAAEARFRVEYPNSQERRACVVALDGIAAVALGPLAAGGRHHATFMTWDSGRLRGLEGSVTSVEEALRASDLVVVVAASGEAAPAAEAVARACAERHLRPVGVVLATDQRAAAAALRPYAAVLVESSDAAYLDEMLAALRA